MTNDELKKECVELLRAIPESWDTGPDELLSSCFIYLDSLRESGRTNMMAAAPYLQMAMEISLHSAKKILSYWMKTFGEEAE